VRRLHSLVALGTLLLGLLSFVPRAGAWTRPPDRIAGADRYETAVRISAAAFHDAVTTVVVASGESFPDGLAAGPLAALKNAPILLTARESLPSITATELGRLAPTQVLVVGGTAAVSDQVLFEIAGAAGVTPSRVAGATRYDTATAVASLFPAPAAVAFVASGIDFPDALAGGAAAAIAVAPLLLTPTTSLPPAVGDQLARLAPAETLVLGGSAAVSDPVVADIDGRVASVRRLAGTDRYGTAAAVATDRLPQATEALLATGETFPDALAAAPFARVKGAPILLTTRCEPPSTVDYLRSRGWADVTVIGGTSAVPEFGYSLPCSPIPDGEVAPGVSMQTQVLGGPNVVRVLESRDVPIRPVTASGRLTGRMTTTEIARGNGVPVAVNGTFFVSSGEPSYALAVGGRLLKAPGAGGTLLATNPVKPEAFFFASPDFEITLADIVVTKVNSGAPGGGEVGLFTTEDPRPTDVGTKYCRAGLAPTGPAHTDHGDTVQDFDVRSVACSTNTIVADDTDVIAALAGTTEGDQVAALPQGEAVRLTWRVHDAATGITDVIGGNITLVHGSQVSTDVTMNSGPFFSERAPRTAIGSLPNGSLVLVVVDGRQPGYSTGMTPRELADFMVGLGCIDAMNLDGGGSTSLVVDGMLANRPSDAAGQRAVGSALLIDPAG
jgi:putative cell wall-binding protein